MPHPSLNECFEKPVSQRGARVGRARIPGASILLSLRLGERNEGGCRTNDSPDKVGKRVRPSRRSRSLTYKGRVDDEFATDPAVRPADAMGVKAPGKGGEG
jgi:hypothetical protein